MKKSKQKVQFVCDTSAFTLALIGLSIYEGHSFFLPFLRASAQHYPSTRPPMLFEPYVVVVISAVVLFCFSGVVASSSFSVRSSGSWTHLNFWSSDAISSSAVWILSVLAWPQNPNMFATLPSSFLGVYQNQTRCYFLSCILILLLRC